MSVVFNVTGETEALRLLARSFAVALEDEGLRRRVWNDLRSSRFTHEHKLHLQDYLRGESGGIVLAKLAQRAGWSVEEARSLLERVPQLELYMPVQAHRDRWSGTDDVIVAAALTEDEAPAGFDLNGASIELSATRPPDRPALVLVPVETDFSQQLDPAGYVHADAVGGRAIGTWRSKARQDGVEPQLIEPCAETTADGAGTVEPLCGGGGGGGGTTPTYPAGIYLEEMIIYDKREPWTRGDPEIEMHMFGTIRGRYIDIAAPEDPRPVLVYCESCTQEVTLDCAGEEETGYRNFNFNGEDGAHYYETVLFASTDRFAPTEVVRSNGSVDGIKLELVRRRVPVEQPFRVLAVERDDGRQCPDKTRQVKLEFTLEFNWFFGGLPVPSVDDFGWEDVLAVFGGGNDSLGSWTFTSYDALEGFNGTWRSSSYAQVKLNNRGFNRNDIPPYWEEIYWQN